jgi:hypothetical protein
LPRPLVLFRAQREFLARLDIRHRDLPFSATVR